LLAQIKLGDMGMEVTMPPQGLPGAGSTAQASLQQMQIFNDNGFYYQCQTVTNGVPSVTLFNVLKSYKLRTTIASETIQGVLHSYAYSIVYTDNSNPGFPYNYYQRADTSGALTVHQQQIPDALRGDELWAAPISISLGGIAFSWLDVNLDGRNWTEIPPTP
jgi:hypothetical protein